jgi:hypothetical protein
MKGNITFNGAPFAMDTIKSVRVKFDNKQIPPRKMVEVFKRDGTALPLLECTSENAASAALWLQFDIEGVSVEKAELQLENARLRRQIAEFEIRLHTHQFGLSQSNKKMPKATSNKK